MENQTTTGSGGSQITVSVTQTVYNGIKQPKEGDIVILHLAESDQIQNNYSREMPAIVSRVFGQGPPFTINMKGLPDGPGTIWRTSIMHQQGYPGSVMAQGASWRWPEEKLQRGSAPLEAVE